MLHTGRKSLLPFLLFCALLTLLALKVVNVLRPASLYPAQSPTNLFAPSTEQAAGAANSVRVIAQLNPNPNSVTANSSPVYSTCSPSAPPTPEPEEAFAACQSSSLNLSNYITPESPLCDDGSPVTDANKGSCVNSSSITLTDAWYGGVNNSVESLSVPGLPETSGYIKQNSNEVHFVYRNFGNKIGLVQDTIWGGGPAGGFFTCDGTNEQAFYRVYDSATNTLGSKSFDTNAQCGADMVSTSKIRSFRKEWDGKNINTLQLPPDKPVPDDGDLSECTVAGQSNIDVTNTAQMIYNGPAKYNETEGNAAVMWQKSGAGADEVTVFFENKGLTCWYQKLDFTIEANTPQYWLEQAQAGNLVDLCTLKDAGGDRSELPSYMEYNLQRQCGTSSELVAKNFLDEYSVTCLPQSTYVLEMQRREECWKTDREGNNPNSTCPNWNTTGELRISATGEMFGLIRNETKINQRYKTLGNLNKKNRQESIEAYLTGRSNQIPGSLQTSADFNSSIPSITDPSQLSVYQSALYKFSTLEQQCRMIYNKLEAVKEMCEPFNRIEGEQNLDCAINQYLPNTSLRYIDLYNNMQSADRCESLMNPDANNAQAIALKNQILNVDPAMEVLYMPAFIVTAELVGFPYANPVFRSSSDDKGMYWQVDYLEVRVPTFGADFLDRTRTTSLSNPSRPGGNYRDPLRQVSDVITPPEIQKKYIEEEQAERDSIRAAIQIPNIRGPVPIGNAIGATDAPIKCRNDQGTPQDTSDDTYSPDNCDNIARALISFINARAAVPSDQTPLHRQFSPARQWVPSPTNVCEVKEEYLYGNSELTGVPLEDKYQVAEQAQTIGSKLQTPERVGEYDKKREAVSLLEANVQMRAGNGVGDPNTDNIGRTRIFYVSPHYYTFLYNQNAFLGLLTTEQQEIILNNESFNSVLKTEGMDTFTSQKSSSTYRVPRTGGYDEYEVSVEMGRKEDDEGEIDSPLMWQTGGTVASYNTRLLALLSTPPGSKMHNYTLGCTGKNATENWLLGKCKSVDGEGPSVEPEPKPAPAGQCINVWPADQQAEAAIIRRNLPGQQAASRNFAGWAAYFSVTSRPQDQHLFRNSCNGNQSCIEYILDRVTQESEVSPMLMMAIALNETGGLISNEPGFIGPHFGCGIDRDNPGRIAAGTIEDKLTCALGFFSQNRSLSSDEALRLYGYANGSRNSNLNKIINIISDGEYTGTCE